MVHEDAAHHAGSHRQEMRAVVPCHVFRVDQPQIRLVDEGGRLKAVTRALSRQTSLRDVVELAMDERNQSLEGVLVATPPFEEEPGDSRGVLRNAQF
jgi:hypothetical protein